MSNRACIVLSLLALLLPSCAEDGDKVQEPAPPSDDADLAVWRTLTGPDGSSPVAGDTLISEVLVINEGAGIAHEVVIVDSLIPKFTFLSAESRPRAAITVGVAVRADSLSLAPGDSAVLRVSLQPHRFFPDGFTVSSRARVTYDHDGSAATSRVLVLSDDPGTSILGDRTRTAVGNDGMDFTLLAPGVPRVYLSGTFNGWVAQSSDYRMFPDENGGIWGLTLPGEKGEHTYKFVVTDASGGNLEWISDPRSTRLEGDGFSGYNSVAGIPLPNPVDPIPGGIDPTRLVIYELLTYDFSTQGDLDGLQAGLTGGIQNLVDLGVNAIELLPMTAVPSPGFNWGYNPGFYFAVDPDYGTPEQFAEFVETAHAGGIAVILDMVFNHADGGSPLVRLDRRGTGGVFLNPSQDDVFGMPQLHWFTTEMREFFLDCALFWIEQYGIDGFRMDLVDGRDYEGYRWWRNQIKSRHPDFFLIGEDFSYPPWNSVTVCGMDAQWGGQHTDQWGCPSGGACPNNFQGVVMALLEEDPYEPRWDAGVGVGCFDTICNPMWALANVLEWTSGYPAFHNEIKYIVSHDERRVVYEVEQAGSAEAAGIGGIVKARLGAATLLTAVGIPMIYMGEEIGADNEVGQHPAPNKVAWNQGDTGLRSYYRDLIILRLNHPTLAGGGIDFHCPDWGAGQGTCQQNKTICYWRYLGSPDQADIVVASNFDHSDHVFDIPFPSSGTWYYYDPDDGTTPVTVKDDTLNLTLAASTAYIFVRDIP
ncbi:MAG: hypothetical protein KAW17_11440 [Candidatus Eisenbacteria sp.]|nr:hypothetical protein [Candidatus Eisenbacteria bacterium]